MAQHSEAKSVDLHEPSRTRILNSTGSQINIGEWVFIGADENAAGFIPISRLANANERDVAFADENIAAGATATVQTLGRLRGANTSAFSVGDFVKLATATTYALAVTGDPTIGRVIVSDASNGVLNIDTITVDINDNAEGLPSLGTAGQELRINSGATALEYFDPNLLPTLGTAAQELRVNAGATDLEYFDPPAAATPSILTDLASYNAARGSGWQAGQQFVTTQQLAVPIPFDAIAASFRINFPATTGTTTIATLTGVINGSTNSFFEIITASTPVAQPDTFVAGAFAAQTLDPFMEQFQNGAGTVNQYSCRTDTDDTTGTGWATQVANTVNAVADDSTGSQAVGRANITTGAFFARRCTAVADGTSVTFTANTAGATGSTIAAGTETGATITNIVQGADAGSTTTTLPTNSLYVVVTPTMILDVANNTILVVV